MDIEELSKSQIVLLVLLVSFVTSMATGIVTVSLMDQAPTSVAQTVNRVIQQTIKEVAATPDQTAAVAVAAPTKTVVVKESDEIAGAVQKSEPSVVRLYSLDGSTFLGMGVVLDSAGTIVTDTSAMGDAGGASVLLAHGESVQADVVTRDSANGLVLLSVATSSESTSTPAWVPVGAPSGAPTLGETVVLLSGETTPWVGSGLISTIVPGSATSPPLVKTDISGDNVLYGSPLIDTDGNLVGISTEVSRESSGSAYVPVSVIAADIAAGNK